MNIKKRYSAILLTTLLSTGCSTYYEATDVTSGKIVYIRAKGRPELDHVVYEAATGNPVAIRSTTTFKQISKEEAIKKATEQQSKEAHK